MKLGFSVWLPLVSVLIVLLAVALMVSYGLPTASSRIEDYARSSLDDQALQTASSVEDSQSDAEVDRMMRQISSVNRGEALFVTSTGEVSNRAGEPLVAGERSLLQRLVGEANREGSASETLDDIDVSVAPVIRSGGGGVVLASQDSEDTIYSIFFRSILEAATIAALIGGALMFLLATLLGSRVQRLASGARAIQRGDLSHRIKPGLDDELGDLARAFNVMARDLESAFERIEEKNTRLSGILETLAEGVMLTDAAGRPLFTNPAARNMLALDGERLTRPPNPWEEFDLPEAVERCLAEGEPLAARVGGEETFLEVRLRRLSVGDAEESGVLVVVQDLSEGRRLEAAQQRFLANASHEVKTPVTSILGASELLLSGDQDDPRLRQMFLENIHDEAQRLKILSQSLLRLARTGHDLRLPEIQPVNLLEAAERGARRMEVLAEEVGMKIVVEGEEAWVRADDGWLDQTLTILLNNAIQHSRNAAEIRVSTEGSTLTVEDDGAGISDADLPHVFERFYRASDAPEGFGLGLPLCRELIERMGGGISLDSTEGSGTVVKVELAEAERGAENPDSRR